MEKFKQEMKWKEAKNVVYPALFPNTKEDLHLLVWEPWLDLAICYVMRGSGMEDTEHSKMVTKQMMEDWGIDEEMLREQAMQNLQSETCSVCTLGKKIQKMLEKAGVFVPIPDINPILIVTNDSCEYCAAHMLNSQLLSMIAGEYNLYLMPINIHDLMVLKVVDRSDMIEWVNQWLEEVYLDTASRERLAGHAYFYDRESGDVELHEQ